MEESIDSWNNEEVSPDYEVLSNSGMSDYTPTSPESNIYYVPSGSKISTVVGGFNNKQRIAAKFKQWRPGKHEDKGASRKRPDRSSYVPQEPIMLFTTYDPFEAQLKELAQQQKEIGEDFVFFIDYSVSYPMTGHILGTTVEMLQADSGCKVHFIPDNGSDKRWFRLIGTRKCIEKAKQLIYRIIKTVHGFNEHDCMDVIVPGHPGPRAIEMKIPGGKISRLIGKSGKTIKKLTDQAQVQMFIKPDADLDKRMERTLQIRGYPPRCIYAQQLVQKMLDSNFEEERRVGRKRDPRIRRSKTPGFSKKQGKHPDRLRFSMESERSPEMHDFGSRRNRSSERAEFDMEQGSPERVGFSRKRGKSRESFNYGTEYGSPDERESSPAMERFGMERRKSSERYGYLRKRDKSSEKSGFGKRRERSSDNTSRKESGSLKADFPAGIPFHLLDRQVFSSDVQNQRHRSFQEEVPETVSQPEPKTQTSSNPTLTSGQQSDTATLLVEYCMSLLSNIEKDDTLAQQHKQSTSEAESTLPNVQYPQSTLQKQPSGGQDNQLPLIQYEHLLSRKNAPTTTFQYHGQTGQNEQQPMVQYQHLLGQQNRPTVQYQHLISGKYQQQYSPPH